MTGSWSKITIKEKNLKFYFQRISSVNFFSNSTAIMSARNKMISAQSYCTIVGCHLPISKHNSSTHPPAIPQLHLLLCIVIQCCMAIKSHIGFSKHGKTEKNLPIFKRLKCKRNVTPVWMAYHCIYQLTCLAPINPFWSWCSWLQLMLWNSAVAKNIIYKKPSANEMYRAVKSSWPQATKHRLNEHVLPHTNCNFMTHNKGLNNALCYIPFCTLLVVKTWTALDGIPVP